MISTVQKSLPATGFPGPDPEEGSLLRRSIWVESVAVVEFSNFGFEFRLPDGVP